MKKRIRIIENRDWMKNITLRNWDPNDYSQACELWKKCGLTLGASDTEQEIQRLIDRNPDLSFVADLNGEIIGTVLGGFDGRRGLIHHLAVEEKFRGKGIGEALIVLLEEEMRKMKIVKINFWLESTNKSLINYYEKLGYTTRSLITLSKSFHPEEPVE